MVGGAALALLVIVNVLWHWSVVVNQKKADAEMDAKEKEFFAQLWQNSALKRHYDESSVMMDRHKLERETMEQRHEKEALADRISENIRPGSASHRREQQWAERQEMWKRHEQEREQLDAKEPKKRPY